MRSPIVRAITAAAVAAVIATPIYLGGNRQGGSVTPGTANLWIDTNGGTCTRSSTPVVYVDAAACSSWSTAYNAASGGDTIDVKCGSYGATTISSRSIGTSVVTIQKDPTDNSCTYYTFTGSIIVNTSYISLGDFSRTGTANFPHGISIGAGQDCNVPYTDAAYPCAFPYTHVTITRFQINDAVIAGVNYFTMSNGEVGPMNAQSEGGCAGDIDAVAISGLTTSGSADGANSVPPDHVTIDGNYIHDITNTSGCGGHTDAVQGTSGYNNWVVTNNRFVNDETCVLAYSTWEPNSYAVDTILFRNNVAYNNGNEGHCFTFGNKGSTGTGGTSSSCGSSNLNNVVENNTFINTVVVDGNCIGSPDGVFRNNIVNATFTCSATGTDFSFSNNDFTAGDTPCNSSSGAITCAPTYTTSDHTTGNADIASGDSCVKNLLTANYPATDIHGTARPQGANADIGAMEVVGG